MDIKKTIESLSEWKAQNFNARHAILITVDTQNIKENTGFVLIGQLGACTGSLSLIAKEQPKIFAAFLAGIIAVAKLNISEKQMKEVYEFSDEIVSEYLIKGMSQK